jgi:malto-oligosyltrehalose trehalohydrolase
VHAFLTGERSGYYQDFGSPEQIVRVLNEGYAFQGEFFKFWGGPRGTPAKDVPLNANVICIQNHDQVGNRAKGERLGHLVSRGAQKAAAALMLLAPHTPMIFMGEEYGEISPFQFFTDYGDPDLQKAVAEGRRKEFEEFDWQEVPDPQDPETFERSKLHWKLATRDNELLNWYGMLLQIRAKYIAKNERTAKAELIDHVVRLSVPKVNPRLIVTASLLENSAKRPLRGKTLLRSAEDGYVIAVNLLPLDTKAEATKLAAVQET